MYLLQGKLTAVDGAQEELASILIEASKLMENVAGLELYLVGKVQDDPHGVYVTELWHSKEDHDNSLQYPGVKELIVRAMPLLDGAPEKGKEIQVLNAVK